ncbi:MAG TPA: prolipoprotein diacylglyceryl transferase [Bacteroidota bacterium]|nr:prolipoprotein diacylglyceryl transferase [Bacteroidota bacterium]
MSHIIWNASPVIFSIGNLSIRWYGLLFALGFIVGYEIVSWMYKNENKPQKDLENLTIVMILATVIGARLGHCFFYEPAYYLAHPIEILEVWKGGLASHGAAIGILVGLWLYTLVRKDVNYLWLLDRIVVPVALAGCFIRLGNFFNSEILGTPSNVPWAIIFARVDDIPRHPVQLYESISYLIIFFILLFTYKKRKSLTPRGLLFGIFLVLIFSARFILEFFKIKQSYLEENLALNMGQILSIPFIIAGIYFWITAGKRKIQPTHAK